MADAAERNANIHDGPDVPWVIPSILNMSAEDAKRVRCVNCSGRYCGHRGVRVSDGKPFAVCALRLT